MRLSQFGFLSACIAATILTACGQNGFLGTSPAPTGDIVITPVNGGTPIVTSAQSPYPITLPLFSLKVTEDHFNGVFSTQFVDLVSSPACYSVTASSSLPNVYVFQANPGAAPPVSTPFPVIEPCTTGDGGTLDFNDGHGHTAQFFYYQAVPVYVTVGGAPPTTAPTPTPVPTLVPTASPSPTPTVSYNPLL
ncbi:MAG TPA: hypothetical protein VME66_04355 [Candidatus Acidoferrales bacterium]|nr:hypothetical protein [Candidatus Acidoferrales bacterium]